MRSQNVFLVLVLTLVLVCAGCSRGAKGKIDTKGLETSFSSAELTVKGVAEKAVAEIKSENYEPAVRLLENLLLGNQITPEQAQAIRGVLKALPAYPRPTP